jgi:hypothetical protein
MLACRSSNRSVGYQVSCLTTKYQHSTCSPQPAVPTYHPTYHLQPPTHDPTCHPTCPVLPAHVFPLPSLCCVCSSSRPRKSGLQHGRVGTAQGARALAINQMAQSSAIPALFCKVFPRRTSRGGCAQTPGTMSDEPHEPKKQAALDEGDIKLLKSYVCIGLVLCAWRWGWEGGKGRLGSARAARGTSPPQSANSATVKPPRRPRRSAPTLPRPLLFL